MAKAKVNYIIMGCVVDDDKAKDFREQCEKHELSTTDAIEGFIKLVNMEHISDSLWELMKTLSEI